MPRRFDISFRLHPSNHLMLNEQLNRQDAYRFGGFIGIGGGDIGAHGQIRRSGETAGRHSHSKAKRRISFSFGYLYHNQLGFNPAFKSVSQVV
jgi:hypothetical protein